MSIRKGNTLIAGNATFGYRPPLLQSFWSDHILNRPDLSRADTFSWQSGKMYKAVYKELVSEYDNESCVEETEGGITFKRTPKGYKIVDKSQEQAILDKYNTHGIAWIYILDKDNIQFKLPRTKFGFEGVRDSVGNDIQAGLPNIRGSLSQMWANSISSDGATIKTEEGTSTKPSKGSSNSYRVTLDASLSSSVYKDDCQTVQESATQMYLYFYVGNYTQSAIEETAGLNAELFNNKADKTEVEPLKTSYIIETYTNGSSWYRIYSDGWCEQGGVSDTVKVNAQSGNSRTVTFLKTFRDTNYSAVATGQATQTDAGRCVGCVQKPLNVDSMSLGFNNLNTSAAQNIRVIWSAKGYLAEGEY